MLKRLFVGPVPGAVMMIGGIGWNAVSNSLAPEVIFVLGAVYAVTALYVENWRLKRERRPKLELVFKPEVGDPYVVDAKFADTNGVKRIYRVGVVNRGIDTAPSVRVLLRAFSPLEPSVRLKHSMVLMGVSGELTDPGHCRDINHSDEPRVFFQIVHQVFYPPARKGSGEWPRLEQALPGSGLPWNEPVLKGGHSVYKFAVEIDGVGAGDPMGFFYEADANGVYTLRLNPFSKQ